MLQNKIVIRLLVVIVVLVTMLLLDYVWRCHIRSLDIEEVIKISNQHLREYIKYSKINADFILSAKKYYGGQQLWTLTYSASSCVVNITVDSCGVSDISGTTQCIVKGAE